MLTTIEGVYKDGRMELSETPVGTEGRRALVTFLEGGAANGAGQTGKGRMITFGMFPGLNEVTDEDFRAAEFHGDSDDGLDWP